MERDFVRTAEVVGNVAKTVYNVGKFVTDRLFDVGGWALSDDQWEGLQAHMRSIIGEDNIQKGEE